MKSILLILISFLALASDAAVMATVIVRTNGVVDAPWGPVNTVGTTTAGIQEAINSLPRVPDIFSGVGGGTIVFAPGEYLLSTNIVIPNSAPFNLVIRGAGFNATRIRYQGTTNNAAWGMATNFVGFSLTNTCSLYVSDCGFTADAYQATNFLWNVRGDTFVHFYNCLFASQVAVTNGQGSYTMNFEANIPNLPSGLVGLAVNAGEDGNVGSLYIDNCLFYGLACGLYVNAPQVKIHDNYFADCGAFNTTPPPANNLATLFTHTNLWKGDSANSNYRWELSCGPAMVIHFTGNAPNAVVRDNIIFGCGALAAVTAGATIGTAGSTVNFRDNFVADQGIGYAGRSYRLFMDDNASVNVLETYDAAGAGAGQLSDCLLTNSPSHVAQPNPVTPPTVPVPTIRLAHSNPNVVGDGWIEFAGQRMIGNGLGITNAWRKETITFCGWTNAEIQPSSATFWLAPVGRSGITPVTNSVAQLLPQYGYYSNITIGVNVPIPATTNIGFSWATNVLPATGMIPGLVDGALSGTLRGSATTPTFTNIPNVADGWSANQIAAIRITLLGGTGGNTIKTASNIWGTVEHWFKDH